MNIKDIFPKGLEPRTNQAQVIKDTIEAIENGYKFIVIEANTGFGKSMVALALANYYNTIYIVCSTKQLQDQYIKDFEEYCNKTWCIMKGKSNYNCESVKNCKCNDAPCTLMKDNTHICKEYNFNTMCKGKNKEECNNCKFPKTNCDKGTTVKEIIPNHDYPCNYWRDRSNFIGSEVGICNYDMLFIDNITSRLYKSIEKDVIIFDESHNLVDKLLKFFSTTINYKDYSFMGFIKYEDFLSKYESDKDLWSYLMKLSDLVKREINYNSSKHKKEERDKLKKLQLDIGILLIYIFNHGEDNLIITHNEYKINIQPLELDNGKNFIEQCNSKAFVFMSATFNNYKEYFKEVGIEPSEIKYIKGISDFNPKKNNPIHPLYKTGNEYKLNYNNIQNPNSKALKELYYNVQFILDQYPEERGVIHTTSKMLKEAIQNNVLDDRLVFYEWYNKEKVVNDFVDNVHHNEVLVTYSHTEGLDLPGDKCRFQILCKVPYPTLADKRTKIMMERNNEWYQLQAIRTITQTVGRGYRFKEDYCDNYILDSSYRWLIKNRNAKQLRYQTKYR